MVGDWEGLLEGEMVGLKDGLADGLVEGFSVVAVGLLLGELEGLKVGLGEQQSIYPSESTFISRPFQSILLFFGRCMEGQQLIVKNLMGQLKWFVKS